MDHIEFLANAGRKGGKAKTPAKKVSGKINTAKALAARWPASYVRKGVKRPRKPHD